MSPSLDGNYIALFQQLFR